jgi:hypothetical protein
MNRILGGEDGEGEVIQRGGALKLLSIGGKVKGIRRWQNFCPFW